MPYHGGQTSTRIATRITADTVVIGTVETRGDLLVEGRVEGQVRCAGVVCIAPGGTCLADVIARRAEIRGEVLGHVTCHQGIAVAAGGRVVGDLRAPDIAIDGAATVGGRVDLLPPAPAKAAVERLPVTPTAAPMARRPPPRPGPGSNSDGVSHNDHSGAAEFRAHAPRAVAGGATTDAAEPQGIPRPPRPRGRVVFSTTTTTS